MSKILFPLFTLGLVICVAGPLQAAQPFVIDGSTPAICAFRSAFYCDGAGQCERVTVEDLNLPTFFKVDFKGNKMTGLGAGVEAGAKKESAIKGVQTVNGMIVLQGVEGRGWSMAITGDTGKMVLSGSGDDDGFMLFGDCIVEPPR